MKSKLNFGALIAFVVITSYATSAETDIESSKEIQTILFAPEGNDLLEPIKPTRTLELLKQLRQHYDSRSDKVSINRRKRLDMLIEVSVMKKEKCDQESMVLFWEAIIKTYFAHDLNIVPYLRVYRLKQFLACKDSLAENLSRDASKLTEVQISDISLFRKLFTQCAQIGDLTTIINWPYHYDPVEELKCSITDFVQQKLVGVRNDDKSKLRETLRVEVEKVFEMCSLVRNTLNSIIGVYDAYMYNSKPGLFGNYDIKELQNKIDQGSLELISSIKICNKILIDKRPLLEGAINILLKRDRESPNFWLKDN